MRSLPFALVLILAGCGGSQSAGGGVLLSGSSWNVERIVRPSGEVVRGQGETLAFGADGSFSTSSCNTCQGRYTLRRDVLEVDGALACTRKACAPDEIELERLFEVPQTVERDGPYLVLSGRASGDEEARDPTQILLLPTQAPEALPTN